MTYASLASGLPSGVRLAPDLSTPGYARFSISSRTALNAGTVPLFNLSAVVPGTAPICAMHILRSPAMLYSYGLQRVVASVQPLLEA